MKRERCALSSALLLCAAAHAQQTIGHVTLSDASVTGNLQVSGGTAILQGGASVVARDHTAHITLDRGGAIDVCATSSLHLTTGAPVGDLTPLLFALDRGALEMRTLIGARDALITPDLRFSAPNGGRVDLRVRVTSNGDTCVENRGAESPTIEVSEQFGDGRYLVPGQQHVLFEHGSIREVVDHESSPCGCPPPVVSRADSGVTVAPGQAGRAGGEAAQKKEDHPFPAAQSQGLAPTGTPAVPQAPPGQVHAQVAATMAYGNEPDSTRPAPAPAAAPAAAPPSSASPQPSPAPAQPSPSTAPPAPVAPVAAPPPSPSPAARASVSPTSNTSVTTPPVEIKAPPPPAPPGATDIAHRIGRFFKHVFGSH